MSVVLITGGTGFIGSRLALRHVEQGDTTRIFAGVNSANESRAADSLRRAGVEVQVGDITSEPDVLAATQGADLVYHLAAAQHEAGVPDSYFERINVEGTRNLFAAAIKVGVGRVVHGSTIGVYGRVEDGVPINESSPLRPDNIYGRTKLDGEEVARSHAQEVSTSIVRISETYGPGDFRLLKMFKGIKRGRFPLIGAGRNVHQLIFVNDLIDGMQRAAITESSGETYLMGGSERLTTVEMIEHVQRAVGSSTSGPRVPMAPVAMAASLCEAVCTPLGVKPPLHRRRLDFFRKSFLLDCSKAREQLGFTATTGFGAGTAATAAWYAKLGFI